MSAAQGGDAAAFVRARVLIVERRKEIEQDHVVVQGEVVHDNGRTTR